jgi:hypothetical protein
VIDRKILIGAAAIALLGSFALGRWTAQKPSVHSVETENAAAMRERDSLRDAEYGPVEAHIVLGSPCAPGAAPQKARGAARGLADVLADLPPGSTVDLKQGASREEERKSSQSVAIEQKKLDLTVKPSGPSLLLGPSVGARLDNLSPTIGGFLMFKAFDPIWLGVAVDSSGSLRVQAALAF